MSLGVRAVSLKFDMSCPSVMFELSIRNEKGEATVRRSHGMPFHRPACPCIPTRRPLAFFPPALLSAINVSTQ